ncbi:MAG TPA: DUF4232 domain-containing protein, partial [Acidothermaceae bacterium]|nr:DUF4232 domain-containing protein [Acidothermaceae bacterium]
PPGRAMAVLVIAGVIGLVSVVVVRGLGPGARHSSTHAAQPAAAPAASASASAAPSPSTLASVPVPAPSSALASLPETAPPSDVSSAPAVQFAPCHAANLQVTAGEGGAATGNLAQPFDITNVGTAGCALQGYPTALEGWQAGAWHRLKFEDGTFFYTEETTPPPVELSPGTAAELIIGTSDACNGGYIGESKLYTRWRATLPGGTIDLNAPINAFCNLDVSSFHPMPSPQPPEPTPTPGPFDALQFQLQAPTTAVEGSTLSYDVTVTNPTDADVALSPCPTWSEVIAVMSDPSPQTVSGPFDCTATPSVRAHSSISIPMVIKVPEAVGIAKFVWWFNGMPNAAVEILTVDGS